MSQETRYFVMAVCLLACLLGWSSTIHRHQIGYYFHFSFFAIAHQEYTALEWKGNKHINSCDHHQFNQNVVFYFQQFEIDVQGDERKKNC